MKKLKLMSTHACDTTYLKNWVLLVLLIVTLVATPIHGATCSEERLLYSYKGASGTSYATSPTRNTTYIIRLEDTSSLVVTKLHTRIYDDGCDSGFLDFTLRNATTTPSNTNVGGFGKFDCTGSDDGKWVNITPPTGFVVRENTNYSVFVNGSGVGNSQIGIQDQISGQNVFCYTQSGGGTGSYTLRTGRRGNIEIYGCTYDPNVAPSLNNSSSPILIVPKYPFDCGVIPRDVNNDDVNVTITHYVNEGSGFYENNTYEYKFVNPTLNTSINTSSGQGQWQGNYTNNWKFICGWKIEDGTTEAYLNSSVISASNLTLSPYIYNSPENDISYDALITARPYFFSWNYSLNGNEDGSAVCNATWYNVSSYDTYNNDSNNFTITSSQYLTFSEIEGNETVLNDSIDFRLCKEAQDRDVLVYINSVLIDTINGNTIPLCTVGYEAYTYTFTQFYTETNFNISLECPSCNNVNRRIRVVSDDLGELVIFRRNFLTHNHDLTYNATTLLYEWRDHGYEFFTNLSTPVTAKCNITRNTTLVQPSTCDVTVSILEINNDSFTNGTKIEASDNYTIIINTIPSSFAKLQINLTNQSGYVLNQTDNQKFLFVNNSVLNTNGIFNISVYYKCPLGTVALAKGWFQLNDTVKPTITFTNPLEDNTSQINLQTTSTQSLLIDFFDTNLFAYDVNITKPDGTVYLNYNLSDINDTTATISESITGISSIGNWSISAVAWDDHTIEEWEVPHEIVGDDLYFTFPPSQGFFENDTILRNVSVSYTGGDDIINLLVGCKKDRCGFAYKFAQQKENILILRLECKDMKIRRYSQHKGHVICQDVKAWVDFNSEDIARWRYSRCGKDCIEIRATTHPDTRWAKFESIGGLNSIRKDVTFGVIDYSPPINTTIDPLNFESCPNTLPQIYIYVLTFLILFALFVIAHIFKTGFVGIFTSFGLFIFGVSFLGCSFIVGAMVIGVSIPLIIYFAALFPLF